MDNPIEQDLFTGEQIQAFVEKATRVMVEKTEKDELERISRIMNKNAPSIKRTIKGVQYVISYRQVPYDNRYFFVEEPKSNPYSHRQVFMKIEQCFAKNENFAMFDWLKIPQKNWQAFMDKVKAFDKELGKDDEVETWLDNCN